MINKSISVLNSLLVLKFDNFGKYLPLLYWNDFWMLSDHLSPINSTTPKLGLHMEFTEIPMWQMQLYAQFTESFRMQTEFMGVDNKETEEIKRMFLETNFYLLSFTMAVSMLHSLFDFLAFKNDISFWKKRKDLEVFQSNTHVSGSLFANYPCKHRHADNHPTLPD